MKKNLLFILMMFAIIISGFSQVPDAFNYQAVVRNSSGEIIVNHNVSFRISILLNSEAGTSVYVETHSVTTNDFGLVNLKIGQGTFVSGAFAPDAWGSNLHFLKVEIDPAGGSSYTFLGTSQLLSVPYAFHAETSNSSQWLNDNPDIYFNGGKVGIGVIPGADLRQFQVKTTSLQAIAAENNSPAYGAIYAINQGGGPAADFRSKIKILDGTQGAGKVLTSDDGGLASWQTPPTGLWTASGSGIYFTGGNVGIGTAPVSYRLLSVAAAGYANLEVKSVTANANLMASTTGIGAGMLLDRNGIDFSAGMYGDNNFTITPIYGSKTGLEVEQDGDVNLSHELHAARTGNANMMPLAYGTVSATGALHANSGNVSITHPATGSYQITISGESYYYQDFITTATPLGVGFIKTDSAGGKLLVFTFNTSGTSADMIFSFVVYKP